MIATLARKELHQHWRAFFLLALLTAGGMVLVGIGAQRSGGAGSVFEGLRFIVITMIPLSALVLSHRLVALEFRQKTQLFLEALPIPRWRMIALKYVFGLVAIFLLAGGALAFACAFAQHTEWLTPHFVAILAARSFAWTWCVYSLLFLTGFLGRYRAVFYIGVAGVLTIIGSFTALPLGEFGPFALIDARFAYENIEPPFAALRTTALLALGCTALSFLMGLVREGTVAALLGEKMSHRERMLMTALVFCGLGAFAVFGERKKKEPYDLPGAVEEARGSVVVKVALAAKDQRGREGALAARAADELAALRDYLGVAELPPVFIVPRAELKPGEFARGTLEHADGVLARANFAAADFRERAFLTWLVREVVNARNLDRAGREPKKWVLDGFAALWENRAHPAAPPADARMLDRARRGMKDFTVANLDRWLSFEQRTDRRVAKATAAALLRTLARRHGDAALRDFVRAVLAQPVPHDARASWRDFTHPASRLLAQAAGEPLDRFLAACRDELNPPPR